MEAALGEGVTVQVAPKTTDTKIPSPTQLEADLLAEAGAEASLELALLQPLVEAHPLPHFVEIEEGSEGEASLVLRPLFAPLLLFPFPVFFSPSFLLLFFVFMVSP